MAKRLIFLICLICWFVAAPAYAVSYEAYSDWTEEQIDMTVSPSGAIAPASVDGETAATEDIPSAYTVNYTVYDDGMISSNYLDWAKGLVMRCGIFEDYVFARTGQYEYIFAHGDWNNSFSGEATVYQLTVANYDTTYSYTVFTDSSFSLSVGDCLVYSSLSAYPSLYGPDMSMGILILLVWTIGFCFVLWLAKMAFHSLGGWRI